MRKTRSVKWIVALSAVLSVILVIVVAVVLIKKPSINEMVSRLMKVKLVSSMKSESHDNITYYYKNKQDFSEGMRFWYDGIVPELHGVAEEYFRDINTKELDIVIFSHEKDKNESMHTKI